jgi:hypothetical protein
MMRQAGAMLSALDLARRIAAGELPSRLSYGILSLICPAAAEQLLVAKVNLDKAPRSG